MKEICKKRRAEYIGINKMGRRWERGEHQGPNDEKGEEKSMRRRMQKKRKKAKITASSGPSKQFGICKAWGSQYESLYGTVMSRNDH